MEFLGLRGVWAPLSAGFGAFEKNKCIFSIAPVGIFGEVASVFLAEKHSPDAGVGSTGRWSRASGVVSLTQCAERTGRQHRTLGGYCSSVRWCVTSASAREEFLTVEHRTLRVCPVACVR